MRRRMPSGIRNEPRMNSQIFFHSLSSLQIAHALQNPHLWESIRLLRYKSSI